MIEKRVAFTSELSDFHIKGSIPLNQETWIYSKTSGYVCCCLQMARKALSIAKSPTFYNMDWLAIRLHLNLKMSSYFHIISTQWVNHGILPMWKKLTQWNLSYNVTKGEFQGRGEKLELKCWVRSEQRIWAGMTIPGSMDWGEPLPMHRTDSIACGITARDGRDVLTTKENDFLFWCLFFST